jgi:hypothetical protein
MRLSQDSGESGEKEIGDIDKRNEVKLGKIFEKSDLSIEE